uniref:Uncharacterized protein n=1 Tax=uncultured marine virus TaxID=186617 RepID=A0A0F7L676_9VIRU|nr:hypothetical protein [uncultured marine virus]
MFVPLFLRLHCFHLAAMDYYTHLFLHITELFCLFLFLGLLLRDSHHQLHVLP